MLCSMQMASFSKSSKCSPEKCQCLTYTLHFIPYSNVYHFCNMHTIQMSYTKNQSPKLSLARLTEFSATPFINLFRIFVFRLVSISGSITRYDAAQLTKRPQPFELTPQRDGCCLWEDTCTACVYIVCAPQII